jgi:predicted peroxiredoxin
VAVFLIDEGVVIARKGATENLVAPSGEEADVAMQYIIQQKIPVYVCTPCANARRVTEDQLIEGAEYAVGKQLIEMAADSKVFTFT